MSGFVPYVFTDAQKVDIRRHCGFPMLGNAQVVFPFTNRQYLTLEYRMGNASATEAAVIIATVATLNTMEAAIDSAAANLDTDRAAVWYHNRDEVEHRTRLYNYKRRKFCLDMGVQPGPNIAGAGGGNSATLVV